jgi:hypothetical protein
VTRICDNCTGKLAMSVDYTSCKCLRYQQARTNVLAIMPNIHIIPANMPNIYIILARVSMPNVNIILA